MNDFDTTRTTATASTGKSEASPGRFEIIASESQSEKRLRPFAAKYGI